MVFVWKIFLNEFISSSHFTLFSTWAFSWHWHLGQKHMKTLYMMLYMCITCVSELVKQVFLFCLCLLLHIDRTMGFLLVLNVLLYLHCHCQSIHALARLYTNNESPNEWILWRKKNIRTQIYTTQHNTHWIQTEQNECNRNHQMSKIYDEMCERIFPFRVCVILFDIVVFLLLLFFRRFLHTFRYVLDCAHSLDFICSSFSFSFIRSALFLYTVVVQLYIFGCSNSTSFVCDWNTYRHHGANVKFLVTEPIVVADRFCCCFLFLCSVRVLIRL